MPGVIQLLTGELRPAASSAISLLEQQFGLKLFHLVGRGIVLTMWLIMQSDKGISSLRLAEAIGVSQPTAWRIGDAVRLMLAREDQLNGIVEADEFYIGGGPRHDVDRPKLGRGRKGQPRTTKTPLLTVIQRSLDLTTGAPAGEARARVIKNLSESEASLVLEDTVEPAAHLMSDEWKSFLSAGQGFVAHDTVSTQICLRKEIGNVAVFRRQPS